MKYNEEHARALIGKVKWIWAKKYLSVPHEYIEIELTESAFFDDKNALIETINRLKNYGFKVSMDDLGAGYSSPNSLKDLPLDILKLDAEYSSGQISEREYAEKMKQGEALISYIGIGNVPIIDVSTEGIPLMENDIVILCSDGLYKRLSSEEILATVMFEEPDMDTFLGLKLAYRAIKEGGSMPTVLNAANEKAVALFLNDRIHFLDIYDIIEQSMDRHTAIESPSVEQILDAEADCYEFIASRWGN